MSILNYFKPKDGLPDPKHSLFQSVHLLSIYLRPPVTVHDITSPRLKNSEQTLPNVNMITILCIILIIYHQLKVEQTLDSFRGK